MLVNIVNKVNISNKITWGNSVLINDCFYLFVTKINRKKSSCSGQSWNEFIFNTSALSQFIIIFEKCFHSNLFFPYLSSYFCLYTFYIDIGSHWIANWDKTKRYVPECRLFLKSMSSVIFIKVYIVLIIKRK